MRVKVEKPHLVKIFDKIQKSGKGCFKEIALKLGANRRTLTDWKNGKTTIPFEIFKELLKIGRFEEKEVSYKKLNDFWLLVI